MGGVGEAGPGLEPDGHGLAAGQVLGEDHQLPGQFLGLGQRVGHAEQIQEGPALQVQALGARWGLS